MIDKTKIINKRIEELETKMKAIKEMLKEVLKYINEDIYRCKKDE